jgi:hypothetical protein
MTTGGAIFTWGIGRQPAAALARVLGRLHITLVVDLRPSHAPAREWGQFFALARGGERILLLAKAPDPRGSRHADVLLPIARDAALYAESALAGVVVPIEIAHLVGSKLVGPLELQARIDGKGAKRPGKPRRRT